jgi:hypothetical protein
MASLAPLRRFWNAAAGPGAAAGPLREVSMRQGQQLIALAACMQRLGLRALLVGNAAAALHGAPVRPRDLDFLLLDTAAQRRRLVRLARELGAELTRPYFHRALRWHLAWPEGGRGVDFVTGLDGVRDPGVLFARAQIVELRGQPVVVAALSDVLRSKRASGRPRDLAVLARLERWLASSTRQAARA